MSERGAMTDEAPSPPRDGMGDATGVPLESLAQRIRRLEDAVASLQDTQQLEERVVEKVSERMGRNATAIRNSADIVMETGQKLLPAALDLFKTPEPSPEVAAVAKAARVALQRPWLLFDAWAEIRTMIQLYVDPRYSLSWATRIGPPLLLVLILSSWFWLPGTGIPILGTLLDKILDLILGFLLYKVLSREVRIYRDRLSDSPGPHPL